MNKAIFEDTRQQIGKHKNIADFCLKNGVELIRQALFVGDYTKITDQTVSVDTKKDLSELVMDLGTDRSRFMREAASAKKYGIKLIVLCEHGENVKKLSDVQFWENPMLDKKSKRYNPKDMTGKMLMKRIIDVHIKYGTEFLFCDKSETGQALIRLLYNE